MHKSRLSTFVIDCKTDDFQAAAEFWSAALGRPLNPAQPGFDTYRDLQCAASEPLLMLQKVDHDSRIHVDIEADDIPAEVERLQALGATVVGQVRTWTVMQAPSGQRFCVVRPQRGALALNAVAWPKNAALPAFSGGPEHEALGKLAGRYHGTTHTFFGGYAPDEECLAELEVDALFGGRFLQLRTFGTVQGNAHAGVMLLGYHRDAKQYELSWIDSFHTGTSNMWCTGPAREDGVIAVTGSYAAGEERWGWRTELHLGDGLTTRAFNILPSGEEALAIETVWRR